MSRPEPPLFSIITVVRNRATTIEQAVDSLAAQSCGDYEHVVQDGASRDGTLELLKAITDSRMQLTSEPIINTTVGLAG